MGRRSSASIDTISVVMLSPSCGMWGDVMSNQGFTAPVQNRFFEDYQAGITDEFGSITVESALGKGTTFILRFPNPSPGVSV